MKFDGVAVPERLGEFRLEERIGGGGMGVVYRAEQTSLGRRIALKLIKRRWPEIYPLLSVRVDKELNEGAIRPVLVNESANIGPDGHCANRRLVPSERSRAQ